jgi:predicted nucleic acid-binding protein
VSELRLQYWDAAVFIEYMSRPRNEKERAQHDERLPVLRALAEHVERGEIALVASTFLRAEVRPFSEDERAKDRNEPEAAKRVQELMESDRIEYIALTPSIAGRAQEIGLQYSLLTPGDCVHIATAEAAGADILFTYDGVKDIQRRNPRKMLSYSGTFSGLRIEVPYDPWPALALTGGDLGAKTPWETSPNAPERPRAQSQPDAPA